MNAYEQARAAAYHRCELAMDMASQDLPVEKKQALRRSLEAWIRQEFPLASTVERYDPNSESFSGKDLR